MEEKDVTVVETSNELTTQMATEEPGLIGITIYLQPETVDFLSWLKKRKKFHTIEEAATWMIEDWTDKFLERISPS